MDKKYGEHPVFQQLAEYAKFYKDLSFSVMGWITQGTTGIIISIDFRVFL